MDGTNRGKGSWAWGPWGCLAEKVVGLGGSPGSTPGWVEQGQSWLVPLKVLDAVLSPSFGLGVPWFSYSWSEHLKPCSAKGNLTFASPETNLKGKLFNIGNYSVSLHLSAYLTYFVKLLCSHRMYYCYSSVKVFRRTEWSLHLATWVENFHYILVKGPIWHGHQYLSNFFFFYSLRSKYLSGNYKENYFYSLIQSLLKSWAFHLLPGGFLRKSRIKM